MNVIRSFTVSLTDRIGSKSSTGLLMDARMALFVPNA